MIPKEERVKEKEDEKKVRRGRVSFSTQMMDVEKEKHVAGPIR